MPGGLLVGVGPTEQVAVSPRPGCDFQAERQTIGVESAGHHYRGHADHVDPSSIAVRTSADLAVLRHGLVGRRHLRRRIDEAVKMQTIQCFDVSVNAPLRGGRGSWLPPADPFPGHSLHYRRPAFVSCSIPPPMIVAGKGDPTAFCIFVEWSGIAQAHTRRENFPCPRGCKGACRSVLADYWRSYRARMESSKTTVAPAARRPVECFHERRRVVSGRRGTRAAASVRLASMLGDSEAGTP